MNLLGITQTTKFINRLIDDYYALISLNKGIQLK